MIMSIVKYILLINLFLLLGCGKSDKSISELSTEADKTDTRSTAFQSDSPLTGGSDDKGSDSSMIIVSKNENTPLHDASFIGDINLVKEQIEKGLNIDVINKSGETPLVIASVKGHSKVVELLIENGSNINPDSSMTSPLHAAVSCGSMEIVDLLISEGANVNFELGWGPKKGLTPLDVAISLNLEKITEKLIKSGARHGNYTKAAEHAIINAVVNGDISVVEKHLNSGVNIDSKSISGVTPLSVAVEEGHINIIKLLLENGSDLNGEVGGINVLDLALSANKNNEIIDILRKYGAKTTEELNRD